MNSGSLEQRLCAQQSLRDWLRNAPVGFYQFPVPDQHTNWRDEQRAWAETAVLFDQSYHMQDVYVSGPDTKRLLAETSINNYENLSTLQAFQYVACNDDGQIIGDAIGFHLRDGTVSVVGKPAAGNWLTYVAETGGYDVTIKRDKRLVEGGPRQLTYRFQLQGPNAYKILEAVNGGPLPQTRFFGMCEFEVTGHKVTALRHGMAEAPGMEFWGPYTDRAAVLQALINAGAEFGLRRGGARTYSTAGPQSGWVGAILPAIYTADAMTPYRNWLPDSSYEANLSIGGSFVPERFEDHYMDPWDTGYHRLIHWEHDFKGRDALLAKRDGPHRKKVWLKWHPEDVEKIVRSMLGEGERYKYLEWPAAHYATCPFDQVLDKGKPIGLAVYAAYTMQVGGWFSIGILDEDTVEFGKEVVITWGEPDGGTIKPTVEPHVQTTIRATIAKSARG